MKKLVGRVIKAKLPAELVSRAEVQAAKEGRNMAEFIRRVVDRYLLEQEFRGDLSSETANSIKKNKELLTLLKDA